MNPDPRADRGSAVPLCVLTADTQFPAVVTSVVTSSPLPLAKMRRYGFKVMCNGSPPLSRPARWAHVLPLSLRYGVSGAREHSAWGDLTRRAPPLGAPDRGGSPSNPSGGTRLSLVLGE